jgi:radical SAM protein with 4Fe4S-binding SPASM domain
MLNYGELRKKSDRVNLDESIPLPYPLSVYVEPTNRCNFKCSFCPESFDNFAELTRGFHFMSLQEMEITIEQLLEITQGKGVKTMNFYMMGEPLMNNNTPDFIEMCRKSGVAEKLILTSNGSLLKGERAKRLASCPPDYLRISIYGHTTEHHRTVTTSRVPLEDIRDNVKSFQSLVNSDECKIYVKMIDQGEEKNQAFLNLFRGCGDEVAIEPVMNWNDPDEGNLAGLDTQDLLKSEYFANKKEVCPSPFYVTVIHSDMNVSVCCVDWAKETVVGNLKEKTLKEIWGGEELRKFQALHLNGKRSEIKACKNCTYIHTFPDRIESPKNFMEFMIGV